MARLIGAVAIACALACAACERRESPSSPATGGSRGRRERVAVTVWIDRKPPADDGQAIVVSTAAPPDRPKLFEQSGMTLRVVGLPKTVDLAHAALYLGKILDDIKLRTDAIVLVSGHCLEALQPMIVRYGEAWWMLAVVAAPGCGAPVASPIGVTALVDARHPAPVRIVFDRATHAILNVE
jgi:hypothetical protein